MYDSLAGSICIYDRVPLATAIMSTASFAALDVEGDGQIDDGPAREGADLEPDQMAPVFKLTEVAPVDPVAGSATELTDATAKCGEVRWARLETPAGHIALHLPSSARDCSLGALTQRENVRLGPQVAITCTPRPDGKAGNGAGSVIDDWSASQAARQKQFNAVIQSIANIVEMSQTKVHFTGTVIVDDVLYRETVEDGKPMYYKVYADLSNGPAHMKIEARGDVNVWVSTDKAYPSSRTYTWTAHDHGTSSRTVTIGDRDQHAICGWYYIAVESKSSTPAPFTLRVAIHANEQKTRGQRGDAGGESSATATSHKNIHERLRLKINEIAGSPDARAALHARIASFRQKQVQKTTTSTSRHMWNVVQYNAGDEACAKYRPRARQEQRAQWTHRHEERVQQALSTVVQSARDMTDKQNKAEQEIERRLMESEWRRHHILERKRYATLQRKWLTWMGVGVRQVYMQAWIANCRAVRASSIRIKKAAATIGNFILRVVRKRRYKKARRVLLSVRSIVRLCSVNNQIIMRHRMTDVIKQFLESIAGVQKNMSSIIKSFAHKVHVLQQSWRRWKAMKDAKIRLWMLLWDQIESAARDDAVPEAARVTMLEEYLRSCKREIIKAKDLQETEMLEFVAKRGATEELKKPKDQRVPNLLTRKTIVGLINEARKRASESPAE